MDGRWKRWAVAGVLAAGAASGCNKQAVRQPDPVALPPATQEQPTLLSRAFGAKPGFVPKAPDPEPVVVAKEKRKPGRGMKPETEVQMAHVEVEAAFQEGKTATERDQLTDVARQRYQKALAADPKNREAQIGMARLYALAGDKDRAIAAYQAAIKQHPKDHQLVHKLAGTQAKFEDWAGAADSCRLALSLDPENRTYVKTLGLCQAQMNQWADAQATLERVMAQPQALYILGRVLIDLNRLDEAKLYLTEAVKQNPEYAVANRVLADLNAGRVNTGEGVVQAGFDPMAAGQPASER
jgi:tetratricopeptide (TPR) repeat protein